MKPTIYPDVFSLARVIQDFKAKSGAAAVPKFSGLCGFDGFIDTFVRLLSPASMAEFGPKLAAAAGIAASNMKRIGAILLSSVTAGELFDHANECRPEIHRVA